MSQFQNEIGRCSGRHQVSKSAGRVGVSISQGNWSKGWLRRGLGRKKDWSMRLGVMSVRIALSITRMGESGEETSLKGELASYCWWFTNKDCLITKLCTNAVTTSNTATPWEQ
jgi:hypothetical protein